MVDDPDDLRYLDKKNSEQKPTIADHKNLAVLEPRLGDEEMRFLMRHKIFQSLALKRQEYIEKQKKCIAVGPNLGQSVLKFENQHMDILKESISPVVRIVRS